MPLLGRRSASQLCHTRSAHRHSITGLTMLIMATVITVAIVGANKLDIVVNVRYNNDINAGAITLQMRSMRRILALRR